MSRVAGFFVALILIASPVLALMCDANCLPARAGLAKVGDHSGHAVTHDPHAHHHAAPAVDGVTGRLVDASGCLGHAPLVIAEARPVDSLQAPALLPHAMVVAALTSEAVRLDSSSHAPRCRSASSVPLRI